MTDAERLLWNEIRGGKLAGLRFRAQNPVGPFILDFYCPNVKLAIEINGPVHDEPAERDGASTKLTQAYGYRIVRFTNKQVMTQMVAVLDAIRIAATTDDMVPDHGPNQIER